jgi:hypothetical protein
MASLLQAYFANIEVYDEQSDQTPTQAEVNIMTDFVSGDLPAAEAARSLTHRTTQATSIIAMHTRKSFLWSFINKIAVNLPVVQPQIVDLLQTIRTLKPAKTVPGEGSNIVCPDDTWSKLDGWPNKWADSINSYEVSDLSPEDEQKQTGPAKWPHVTAYSARLMATRDPVIADLFFIRRSAASIVRSLDTDQDQQSEPDVIAAAQLFILSPRELFERCQAGDSIEGLDKNNIAGTHLWDQDMLKLSVERWEHWKARWQSIRDANGVSDKIRTVASRSLDAMKAIG